MLNCSQKANSIKGCTSATLKIIAVTLSIVLTIFSKICLKIINLAIWIKFQTKRKGKERTRRRFASNLIFIRKESFELRAQRFQYSSKIQFYRRPCTYRDKASLPRYERSLWPDTRSFLSSCRVRFIFELSFFPLLYRVERSSPQSIPGETRRGN